MRRRGAVSAWLRSGLAGRKVGEGGRGKREKIRGKVRKGGGTGKGEVGYGGRGQRERRKGSEVGRSGRNGRRER